MVRKRATTKPPAPDLALHRRIVARLHQLSVRFRQLHHRGSEALEAHDYRELGHVIKLERAVIRRHLALIERSRAIFRRRLGS